MAADRFTALRSRDFRLLLLGQAVSLTGSQMQQVAVIWQLYLVSGTAMSLGLLGIFQVIPIVIFSLGGGVVADSFDRRKLMIVSQVGLMLSSVLLALATCTGHMSAATIYALAIVSGAAKAFEAPARQALLPQLVSREELSNALSLYATVRQVAMVAGPALGGAILAWRGALPIYLFDVASFLAVLGALVIMSPQGAPARAASPGLEAAVEGIVFMLRSPLILTTALLDFVATFFGGSMLLLPIFADQLLRVGPRGLGLLYAAQPLGAAIAGGIMAALPTIRRQGMTVVTSVGCYGAAIAAFGMAGRFPLAFAALALSGAADTVSMVLRQTLRQLLTPDELRGRMTSINLIFAMGGPLLGEGEAGAVASAMGARFAVASGGVVCMLVAGAVGLLIPALRRYEGERAVEPSA